MQIIRVEWATIKTFIQDRGAIPQRIIESNAHTVSAFDGAIGQEAVLRVGKHDTEIAEYETLFLSIENGTPLNRVARRLATSPDTLNPRAILIDIPGSKLPANPHVIDKVLTSSTGLMALRGGYFWTDPTAWFFGDTLKVEIIDKDDVLGLGGTPSDPTIVETYLKKDEFYVIKENQNLIDETLSDFFPNGLYLRCSYYQGAGATRGPKAILNLMAYEV